MNPPPPSPLPVDFAVRRGADAVNGKVGAFELFLLAQAQSHDGLEHAIDRESRQQRPGHTHGAADQLRGKTHPAQAAKRRVEGRVIGQDRLTSDIVRLRVQLDESFPYKAGQFANIGIASQPGVSRSYSFATAVQPDAQVSFFVRKVPDGQFSSLINDANVLGQAMSIEGPMGDFWLRPAEAPLLLIAGGSGLAPVLAMLQDALNNGVGRPVTLLFGARREGDLYALDAIQAIARQWPAAFRFVPVLSQEPEGSAWPGLRGLVTDQLAAHLQDGAHAYLCGPPAMIDSAVNVLRDHGVPREHIHADRFTTQQDVPVTA